MKKAVAVLVGITMISAPAFAQVRPENCVPVFPLEDPVAASLPQSFVPADVIAQPAVPLAAASRGFFGLPLLLPLLAAAGGAGAIIAADDDGDGGGTISPA